ncbi:MAG: DUF1467 family protein [Parvibaculum sp.]
MTLMAGLAIYAVIWWTVLFAILPWGVVTQEESHAVVPGSSASAPAKPLMLRKVLVTSVLAAFVWLGVYYLVVASPFSFEDIPFMPAFTGKY